MLRSPFAAVVVSFGCVIACGPHGIVTPPRPPTAVEILGQNEAPLIIDWEATARGNLEVAMTKGVAVLSYKDGHMRLLPDCKLEGSYGYVPFRIKEEVVSYQSSEDIRANLPLAGGGFVAKIGGELDKGASLDVALVMVGKRASTWTTAKVEETKGGPDACKDATHFVRGAYVGAFAMQLGSKASAHTVVQIFNGEAGWQAAASQSVRTVDGSLDECRKSNAGVDQTTANCGSLLHLELVELGATPVSTEAAGVGGAGCPQGFVREKGTCRKAAAVRNHECKASDASDCETQCAAGNSESCTTLAWILYNDRKGKRDYARSYELYRKACDGGSVNACAGLGLFYHSGFVVKQDFAKAVELFKHACESGSARGCSILAYETSKGLGVERDKDKALALYRRSCDGGWANGCNGVGAMYDDGLGVARDLTKAAAYYRRACDGDNESACRNLANVYFDEDFAARSALQGEALLMHACDEGSAYACKELAGRYASGNGLPKNPDGATKRYMDAVRELTLDCGENVGEGCSQLADLYASGYGVPKDLHKAQELTQRSCDIGDFPLGCGYVGQMYMQGWYDMAKDATRASQAFDASCKGGSGYGCFWLAVALSREDETANAKRIIELYDRGCTLDEGDACSGAALAYARGDHVDADPKKAAAYYTRACVDMRHGISCTSLGVHAEHGDWATRDDKKADEYYALGCKYGNARGCNYLAMNLRDGTGAEVDNARAAKLFDKACDMGETDACDKLIAMYLAGKAGSPETALDLERKQCDAGRPDACNAAGMLLEQGAGSLAKNELQAAVFFQKACEKKSATGCVNLGDMYMEGRGTGKDEEKALSFYRLACDVDGGRGCGLSAKMILARRTSSADDVKHAIGDAQRGCDKHDGVSCAVLGAAFETGRPPALARNLALAFDAYDDGCDAGDGDACIKAGQMLERGYGTTRDAARARGRYLTACVRRDARGCAAVAAYYARGDAGVPADGARAHVFYARACVLGDKASCARADATH